MRTRLGLKVLGLSALVMGVMAIGTAGVAQAEVGACWGYESASGLKCFGENELLATTSISLSNNTGTLLINNVNLEVLCTGGKLVEGGQLSSNGSVLSGRVEFSGCISLSKTPTLAKLNSCTPNDPVAGLGKIRTEKGHGLIVLHSGEPVVLLLPASGTTLAKIFLGEECAVSEELIVSGHLVLHDTGGKTSFEEHKLEHLIEELPALRLMKVGVNSASVDGVGHVTLNSPHNALKWAGHTTK